MSGSSARPMRSVVWANAPAWKDSNSAAVATAKRIIFIARVPFVLSRPDYSNPATCRSFLRKAEGGDQLLQRWRESAIVRHDTLGRRQFRHAMTSRLMLGGCMSRAIGQE